MSAMAERNAVRTASAALALAGLLFAAVGGVFYWRAWQLAKAVEDGSRRADAQCGQLLTGLGAVERTADGFRLTVADVNEPRAKLADASAIVAACPDYPLTRFCMGKGCLAGDKVALVMELAKPR
jgi:hypothetical protein